MEWIKKDVDSMEIQPMVFIDGGHSMEPAMGMDVDCYTVFVHKAGEGLVGNVGDFEDPHMARFMAGILRDWIAKETGKDVIIYDYSTQEE